MKDLNEFIEKLVEIRFVEGSNAFGHYPFQLYVELLDGKVEMNALLLGGNVKSVYNRVKQYVLKGFKRLYLSVDFPAVLDIEHDFVCAFSIENDKLTILAIPYDTETGDIFERITNSKALTTLLQEFKLNTNFKEV